MNQKSSEPWFQHYPKGINLEISPEEYSSIVDLFEKSCAKFRNRPAFVNMGKTITFAELDRLSRNFSAYLQNVLGLKKGDRIALQMPNLLQYPVALFGALRAGLVVVNTNPLYTPREMEHQFKDSGAKAIVILANFAHNLEKVLKVTPIEHVIVTELGDLLGFPKSRIVNFVVKKVKKMVPTYQISSAVSFTEALKIGSSQSLRKVKVESEDLAFLQYTGGTTGVAKGAMLSHRNMVANMLQISAWMSQELEDGVEIVVTALPMYHIFSLTVNCLSFMCRGGKNLLITNPKDIPAFVAELKKHRFTVFCGLNTLFNALCNNEAFCKEVNFSSLKVTVAGGMAVQKAVAERWASVTGNPVLEGFGLTETSPVLTCNPLGGGEQIGTIGMPLPSTEVKILDDDEKEVPLGTAGEIVARGPQVMKGYWQRDDETAKVMSKDGFFKTGDIAIMQPDGFFKIVDRKKDMILVSGFNVYPNEIEDVVVKHPSVLEAAAIGVPDEKSGEVVKLFIVRKDPKLSDADIIKHCKEYLTNYKVPRYVVFKDELPKSNVGKILRKELRNQ
jgi:long-chain acyl-CoA synthetase